MSRHTLIANDILLPEMGRLIGEGHTVTLTVKGASMSPFIVHLRDKVVLGPFEADALKKGDVVLAREHGGQFVLHRIIAREGDKLTLKGDGNASSCEYCSTADVYGLVHGIIRKGRAIGTSSLIWRCYSCAWMTLSPLRRWLLAIWRRL